MSAGTTLSRPALEHDRRAIFKMVTLILFDDESKAFFIPSKFPFMACSMIGVSCVLLQGVTEEENTLYSIRKGSNMWDSMVLRQQVLIDGVLL